MPSSTCVKGGAKGNSTVNFQPFPLNQNVCYPKNSGRSVKGTHQQALLALHATGPHAIVSTNSCMALLTPQHLMQHCMSPARQSADPNPLPPRLAALKSIMPSRGSMEKRPSAIKPPDMRHQLSMVGRTKGSKTQVGSTTTTTTTTTTRPRKKGQPLFHGSFVIIYFPFRSSWLFISRMFHPCIQ